MNISLGNLNEDEITYELQKIDLGISSVPHHTLGKSGSVMAFLSHGVPIAAPVIHYEYERFGIGII